MLWCTIILTDFTNQKTHLLLILAEGLTLIMFFLFSTCPTVSFMAKAPPAERKAETLQQLRANEADTKSCGESACNPPTWMELPSLAKCTCRWSGIAALAILLGKWDLSRNSLFKSNSFTWSATASFLCRPNGIWKHLLLIQYRW